MATDSDVLHADLVELLTVLGMSDHARPQSPHEVFQEALGVLRERLAPRASTLSGPRREKAYAIAEAAANRWDKFDDRTGVGWLVDQILCLKTGDDDRIVAWANRSVRQVQDSCFAEIDKLTRPKPLNEWHEEDGEVLWWIFPVRESPYCGSPIADDWPGYHTHWTPLPEVREP